MNTYQTHCKGRVRKRYQIWHQTCIYIHGWQNVHGTWKTPTSFTYCSTEVNNSQVQMTGTSIGQYEHTLKHSKKSFWTNILHKPISNYFTCVNQGIHIEWKESLNKKLTPYNLYGIYNIYVYWSSHICSIRLNNKHIDIRYSVLQGIYRKLHHISKNVTPDTIQTW